MGIKYTDKPLRKRSKRDYYPTPRELPMAALWEIIGAIQVGLVLDSGAGTGVWGIAARRLWGFAPTIIGVDVQEFSCSEYDAYYSCTDYLSFSEWAGEYSLIMGNPPFSLAHEFVDHSLQLLKDGGSLLYLLPLSFLESQKRYEKYYRTGDYRKPTEVYVSTRRVSFTGDKKSDDTAYALYKWTKGVHGGRTALSWLDWHYDE